MPASGALGPFLETMLGLRAQRLKEQEMKEQAMADMGKSIASGVSSLGEGLTKGMEKSKTDALAEKLGKQAYGADWQGGGKEELELRRGMADIEKTKGEALWQQQNRAMQVNKYLGQDPVTLDRIDRAKTAKGQAEASKALANSDKAFQAAYKNSLAYQKSSAHLLEGMAKATTPEAHRELAQQLRALNDANRDVGLNTPLVGVTPFVSADEQEALKQYNESLAATQGQPATTPYTGVPYPGTPFTKGVPSPITVQSPAYENLGKATQALQATRPGTAGTLGPYGVPGGLGVPVAEPGGPQGPPAQRMTPDEAQALIQSRQPQQGGGQVPIPGKIYRNPTTTERRVYLGNDKWQTLK